MSVLKFRKIKEYICGQNIDDLDYQLLIHFINRSLHYDNYVQSLLELKV